MFAVAQKIIPVGLIACCLHGAACLAQESDLQTRTERSVNACLAALDRDGGRTAENVASAIRLALAGEDADKSVATQILANSEWVLLISGSLPDYTRVRLHFDAQASLYRGPSANRQPLNFDGALVGVADGWMVYKDPNRIVDEHIRIAIVNRNTLLKLKVSNGKMAGTGEVFLRKTGEPKALFPAP